MSTSLQSTKQPSGSINFDVISFKKNSEHSKSDEPVAKMNRKNKQAVATLVTQTIKKSFDDEMLDLIESYISVRLTSTIRNGFGDDDKLLSIGGKTDALTGFDFNTSKTFSATVNSKVFVRGGSHNGYAILHIPAFVPEFELDVPGNATNFKVCAKLVAISDFSYAENSKSYNPKNVESHGSYGTFETTMLPVLKMQTQPVTSQICINRCKPLGKDVRTVLVMAIKFYNYQKGKFTHLSDEGTMKIMNVF